MLLADLFKNWDYQTQQVINKSKSKTNRRNQEFTQELINKSNHNITYIMIYIHIHQFSFSLKE